MAMDNSYKSHPCSMAVHLQMGSDFPVPWYKFIQISYSLPNGPKAKKVYDPTTRTVATHLFSWAKKNKQWGPGSCPLKKWLLFLPQKNGDFPGRENRPNEPFPFRWLHRSLECLLSHKATWITWSIWATKEARPHFPLYKLFTTDPYNGLL